MGPPRSGAGVGVGMLRGAGDFLMTFIFRFVLVFVCYPLFSIFIYLFLKFYFKQYVHNGGNRVFKKLQNFRCPDLQT